MFSQLSSLKKMLISYAIDLCINAAVVSLTGQPIPLQIELLKSAFELGIDLINKE